MLRKTVIALALMSLLSLLLGCNSGSGGPFEESFDQPGSWGVGENENIRGEIRNGVYDLLVYADQGVYWVTPSETFGDGTYSVDATPVGGPIDNGYGLVFMLNEEDVSFYLFEVSGDGYVWIGRCEDNCQTDIEMLVDTGWFPSNAVNTGLNETNNLKVTVSDGEMTFFVNDLEVGRAFDQTLENGNVGLAVETLGVGGVQVEFDNLSFSPE